MYFLALATDYDGTLAHDGVVDPETIEALHRLKQSGRRVVLVTGRELGDLQRVFPELKLCDLAVVENGALLYNPTTDRETPVADPPPEAFVRRLQELNVRPLSIGRSIVATWEPMETVVLEAIRELGLELQITFNKGAVMVLPAGINKASGLAAALGELGLSRHNLVGVGDAENDHAFLSVCGCSVAVANALDAVKDTADLTTAGARGKGVIELIDDLIATDLRHVVERSSRHRVTIGADEAGAPVHIDPIGGSILVAGVSGGGKSTKVAGILEQLAAQGFQYIVIDPEGDYAELEDAVVLGDAERSPRDAEAIEVLRRGDGYVVLNLLGVDIADRPGFLAGLLPQLCQLRQQTGRPHWIVIDEAHHMLPATPAADGAALPQDMRATILVTVHPDQVALAALQSVRTVMAVGAKPADTIRRFCEASGDTAPTVPDARGLEPSEALVWERGSEGALRRVRITGPRQERRRHTRKYAEGELGPDRSFYFRGPAGALNLRAQNLSLFVHMAEGIDDATWLHHLAAGDYSAWVRDSIKDDELAADLAAVERDTSLDADASRGKIRKAIESRYTGPAAEGRR